MFKVRVGVWGKLRITARARTKVRAIVRLSIWVRFKVGFIGSLELSKVTC